MGDDGLSIAVIANPGWFIPSGGDFSYIEKALWKLPSQEFAVRKESKLPITTLDAILVVGNLVGSLLKEEEDRALQTARKKLDEEFQRNRESYHAQNVTDLAGVVEELMHSPRAPNFNDEIAVFRKLIGVKRGRDWIQFGEAKDRAVQRYEQLMIAIKAFERKYAQIPAFFAADTFLFEQVVPEQYWLHWRDLSFKTKLIKAFGNSNVKGIIPEFVINPLQRGKANIDLDLFTSQLGHVTVSNRLPTKLHELLLQNKGHTVVVGQRTNLDTHYPGNLVIRQDAGYADVITFAEPTGIRAQYRWDIASKKFTRVNEATIQNMVVTSTNLKETERKRQVQLDQLRHIRELMDMEAYMDQFAKQREQGYDTPEKLRKHIEELEAGRDSVQKYRMRFEPFIDELMKEGGMIDWYIGEQKKLEAEIASGAKSQLEADLARFDLVLAAVKQDVLRHKTESRITQEHNLAAIKELQAKIESRDTELAALKGLHDGIEAILLKAALHHGVPYSKGGAVAEGTEALFAYAADQRENVLKLNTELQKKDKTFQEEFDKKNKEIEGLQKDFGGAQDALVVHLVGMLKPVYDCYHAMTDPDSVVEFDKALEAVVGKEVADFFALLPAGESFEIQSPEIAKIIYERAAQVYQFARASLRRIGTDYPRILQNLIVENRKHTETQQKVTEERRRNNELIGSYSQAIGGIKSQFDERVEKRATEIAGTRIRDLEARAAGLESELAVAKKQIIEIPALERDKIKDEHQRSTTVIRREQMDALGALRAEYEDKLDAMRKDYEHRLASAEKTHPNGQLEATRQQYVSMAVDVAKRAHALVGKQQFSEGIALYTIALKHVPADDAERRIALYRNRGVARINAKDVAGAIEDFTAALTLKPGDQTLVLYRSEAERIKVTTTK